MDKLPSMQVTLIVIALVALITLPTILAFTGKSAAVIAAVTTACVAAAILIRLPDLQFLKLGPLEARLERAVEKAEATIGQLQQLAAKLARPTLATMGAAGRLSGGTPRQESVEVYEDTIKLLRELGSKETDIDAALASYRYYVEFDMTLDAEKAALSKLDPNKQSEIAKECFNTQFRSEHRVPVSTMRDCLLSHNLLTPDVNEALLDLEQFRKDFTFRRRGVFIANGSR